MEAHDILIILNLIIVESILSVDNATALAAMVQHLPEKQRAKALKYGLIGAYVFRGLCLLLATYLMKVLWLKIAGGLYLLYLTFDHFKSKSEQEEGKAVKGKGFWMTIVSVELLDLSLSIDNVFAAVALSDKFWVVMLGVGIGILAMRFVATWFVKVIKIYPYLETSAFIVIALLGLKLIVSGTVDYTSWVNVKHILESHWFDLAFSSVMMAIFFVPMIFKKKQLA